MKVLIVGSGGREHAIAWSVAKSDKVEKIYCAPGNAGIAQYAECVAIGAMEFEKLAAFAKEHEVDLTIVGMDDPLVGGIVDVFESEGLRVFGPRKKCGYFGRLQSIFKRFDEKYNIPQRDMKTLMTQRKALAYLETAKFPIVLKGGRTCTWKKVY